MNISLVNESNGYYSPIEEGEKTCQEGKLKKFFLLIFLYKTHLIFRMILPAFEC